MKAILTFVLALIFVVIFMYALSYPLAYLLNDMVGQVIPVTVNGVFETLVATRLFLAAVR